MSGRSIGITYVLQSDAYDFRFYTIAHSIPTTDDAPFVDRWKKVSVWLLLSRGFGSFPILTRTLSCKRRIQPPSMVSTIIINGKEASQVPRVSGMVDVQGGGLLQRPHYIRDHLV